MGIAYFIALSAVSFTGGFGFALNQTAVGSKVLYCVKACNVANFVQNCQCHNAANAGEAGENMIIIAVVMLGVLFNKPLDCAEFMAVKRDDV